MAQNVTLDIRQGGKGIFREACASIDKAVSKARLYAPETERTISLGEGRHYLEHPLVLDSRDQGLTITAQPGTRPILVGGRSIKNWQPDGTTSGLSTCRTFVRGNGTFACLLSTGALPSGHGCLRRDRSRTWTSLMFAG